jgi:hypothetical protein
MACAARKQKYGMVTMCIGTGMGFSGDIRSVVVNSLFRDGCER